jgi:adenine-specific DNA-methyltransferase
MESINDYMPLSNDWNNERLQTLKQLYPDWFTNEGSLNIDEVKKAVNPDLVSETERYEFRWFGKSQAKRNAFTPSDATLVFDEARSVNPNHSENLIIEGENLEVLKLLSNSYREKIKCIYIDPPYNTGSDFVYSDNFIQDKKGYWEDAEFIENGVKIDTNTETDGRYHSNWLNLMYSRLLISRQLLTDDGTIFIQIDDNEFHNAILLMNEIFGEENFISTICVKMSHLSGMKMTHKDKKIPKIKEFIIIYSKNRSLVKLNTVYTKGEWENVFDRYTKFVEIKEKENPECWKVFNLNEYLSKLNLKDDKAVQKFKIENANKIFRTAVNDSFKNESKDLFFRKIITRTGIEKFIHNGEEVLFADKKIVEIDGEKVPAETIGDIWTDIGINNLHKEGEIAFENGKKPLKLLKRVLSISTSENDIILDFFAGSGSSAHALMELNKEDQQNRKYICVQLPEATNKKSEAYKSGFKKISDITIERNKRVVEKIIKEKESKQPDLFTGDNKQDALKGLGFKVFKLQKSNFPRVDFALDPEKTEEENIASLKQYIANKEAQMVNAFNKPELLTEILLKNGFNLNFVAEVQDNIANNEVFLASDGEKETLICLDVVINPETVDYFKSNTGKKFICLERALDTTKKYNLKHYLGDKFNAF